MSDSGQLFVVGTPIGNLEDITLRAISTLQNVDMVLAEDTRNSKKLLDAHHINTKMISYHEHSSEKNIKRIIDLLLEGKDLALISDAGTPTISDPGYGLIRDCIKNNIIITPIPGASAITAAMSISGLPSDSFTFVGFLPQKKGRVKKIEQLKNIDNISKKLGAPILSDISSNITSNNNIISFYDHFIDSIEAPDLIIRFGKKPLSKKLLSLLKKYNDITYLFRFRTIYNDDILQSNLINHVELKDYEYDKSWISTFKKNDNLIKNKIDLINKNANLNEFTFSNQISKKFPENSNVFIGNSLIIRAFNSFSKKQFNKIKFYSNRGTSGIDGNIATALGIASQSIENNYLVIGDQSFMHDIGSLQILAEKKQKLSIFIINNYGGSIFNYLPNLNKVDSYSFKNYILNRHSNEFESIVKSYGMRYKRISSINDLKSIDINESKVYEIIIDEKDSIKYIRNFSTSLYSQD